MIKYDKNYKKGTSIGGIISLAYSGTLDGKTPIMEGANGGVNIFKNYGNKIFGSYKSKIDPLGLT